MMNPEIKQRWVEALRSGKYKQGRGYLEITAGDGALRHCCLGVLCDLVAPDVLGVGRRKFPPPEVLEVAGLAREQASALAEMNDGLYGEEYSTFSQIADYIEENL